MTITLSTFWEDAWDWEEGEGDLMLLGDVMAGPRFDRSFFRHVGRDPELARMPYRDYLRTPHWRNKRTRALQRAGYQCQRCGASRLRLHVHHLTYNRLGRELEGDLTVLCELCHAREHEAA